MHRQSSNGLPVQFSNICIEIISKFIYNNMSLTDKINSVQGIALSALQATANLNTYLEYIYST
jgi:hypothetical protein